MRFIAVTAAALFFAGAALADQPWDRCQEPFGPLAPTVGRNRRGHGRRPKGGRGVHPRLRRYQECLLSAMDDRKAKEEDKLSPGQKAQMQRMIESNQREKEMIGNEYNEPSAPLTPASAPRPPHNEMGGTSRGARPQRSCDGGGRPDAALEAALAKSGAPALAALTVTREGIEAEGAAGVRALGASDRVTSTIAGISAPTPRR